MDQNGRKPLFIKLSNESNMSTVCNRKIDSFGIEKLENKIYKYRTKELHIKNNMYKSQIIYRK